MGHVLVTVVYNQIKTKGCYIMKNILKYRHDGSETLLEGILPLYSVGETLLVRLQQ